MQNQDQHPNAHSITANDTPKGFKNSPRYRWFILANVAVGTFMATLDSSIVNVALPTMSGQLHAQLTALQWVVSAYLLTISSLLPIFGRTADLLGRKRIYSLGFIVFTLGSFLCGLSTNLWFLVVMRIFQAIGASMLMANSAAIITAAFSPRERGLALGMTGTVVALGSLAGPAVGGLLIGATSWRAIFFINIPIGIMGYLAAQIILPADEARGNHERFDFSGSILFTLGMVSLLFAFSNGQDWGWGSTPILTGLVAGIILLILFFTTELRVPNPMIELSLFKNRPFLAGNVSSLLSFVALFSNTMLMPFYLQHILNYSTTQVGLFMTSFPLVMAVVAPISGYASDKIGPIALTTGGLVMTGLGFLYLSTISATASAWQIIPGPLLNGLGAGMFNSPNNSSVMSSVPPPKLGIAGGINALVRNVGMVLGIAFSVSLFENREAAHLATLPHPSVLQQTAAFMSAYHTVMLAAAGIAFTTAFISLNRKGYARAQAN
ncbi:MAG: MFS transporter [Desulfitobacteriaceae bacterium]|nr:MFS transporter [Desulfitobacteriaceae bacterium]